ASIFEDAAVATMVPLGARRVDITTVVDKLSGIERTVSWWHDNYEVLLALLDACEVSVDDLGALPVPLADGRTVAGPRNSLIPDVAAPALDTLVAAGVVGLRLLHAEADHPLLRRLGAREVGAAELLTEPVVGEAVRASMADVRAGADGRLLAYAVLRLVAESGDSAPNGFGGLALPGRSGWRRADELVLPDAEVLQLLDPAAIGEDAPLDVLADG